MSVYLYSGTPGSGKSYEAVRQVINNLKMGLYVVANFAIKFNDKEIKKGYDKRFFYWKNDEITVSNLITFAVEKGMIENKKEHQCMVVVDEAGGRFNCRKCLDKENKNEMKEWIDFFSQHMKLGYDFILVAQNDRMIDRQIRSMVETEFRFRQINRFGFFQILPLKIFVKVEYWYVVKERVSSQFILFRMKVAQKYDRYKMFSGFSLSGEIMKKINMIENGIVIEKEVDPKSIDLIFIDDNITKEE